jgi:hypothetical protein
MRDTCSDICLTIGAIGTVFDMPDLTIEACCAKDMP